MNRELRKVKKWLDANQLALNIEKTNFVIFHSPQRKIEENIVIKIEEKDFSKDICQILRNPSRCTFELETTDYRIIKKNLPEQLVFFIRHFVPLETIKVLYFSLFYSFVSYGIAVWGLTHKSFLDPLIISQKKSVRNNVF